MSGLRVIQEGIDNAKAAERVAVLAFIEKRAESVAKFVDRGRLTAEEGSRLNSWIRAVAGDIKAGLHVRD